MLIFFVDQMLRWSDGQMVRWSKCSFQDQQQTPIYGQNMAVNYLFPNQMIAMFSSGSVDTQMIMKGGHTAVTYLFQDLMLRCSDDRTPGWVEGAQMLQPPSMTWQVPVV